MKRGKVVAAGLTAAAMLFASSAAFASHQWGSYHWERDGVTVQEVTNGDNHVNTINTNWQAIFDSMVPDWASDAGGGYGGSNFGAVDSGDPGGDVKSFNDDYGDNGWLGLASIWITRGKNKHITRGEAKVNDFYITYTFPDGTPYTGFDEPVEWEHVMCQEIGHTFGLGHTTSDNSCMNTEDRPLRYPNPNDHDTEMFNSAEMYGHDHGDGGGGGGGSKKCHPVFGCPGAPGLGHAVWAEQYESLDEMFDAADAVVDVTVLSSGFDRMVGQAASAVPVTRVVLKVTDTLSGFTRRVIVLEQTRGPSLEFYDDPGYVTGDSYTLFLREIDNNTYRIVNPDGRIRQ